MMHFCKVVKIVEDTIIYVGGSKRVSKEQDRLGMIDDCLPVEPMLQLGSLETEFELPPLRLVVILELRLGVGAAGRAIQ